MKSVAFICIKSILEWFYVKSYGQIILYFISWVLSIEIQISPTYLTNGRLSHSSAEFDFWDESAPRDNDSPHLWDWRPAPALQSRESKPEKRCLFVFILDTEKEVSLYLVSNNLDFSCGGLAGGSLRQKYFHFVMQYNIFKEFLQSEISSSAWAFLCRGRQLLSWRQNTLRAAPAPATEKRTILFLLRWNLKFPI